MMPAALERGTIDHRTVLELLIEAGDVDALVLDATGVAESRELGQTHRKRGLATLETGALAATGAGELALLAATRGGAMTGGVTAADALTAMGGTWVGVRREAALLLLYNLDKVLDLKKITHRLRCRHLARVIDLLEAERVNGPNLVLLAAVGAADLLDLNGGQPSLLLLPPTQPSERR